MDPGWWWVLLVGHLFSLALELVHEVVENLECMINRYRDNSGTSAQYAGDSFQNIGTVKYYIGIVNSI